MDWFKLDASYEQADIDQAFTAAAPTETDRLRVGARFLHGTKTKLDLGYLAFENSNAGVDFRRPGECSPGDDVDSGCWNSLAEGTTISALIWHRANENFDFWFRWAEHDIDRVIRIHYDTDGFFGATDVGDSIYGSNNTEWSGQLNYSWASRWKAFVRAQLNESDGENSIVGTMYANTLVILQDYSDIEAGVTYTFPKQMYLGARFRSFDYDDDNDSLDYDGEIVSIVAGMHF
jgi:hypothetical protein